VKFEILLTQPHILYSLVELSNGYDDPDGLDDQDRSDSTTWTGPTSRTSPTNWTGPSKPSSPTIQTGPTTRTVSTTQTSPMTRMGQTIRTSRTTRTDPTVWKVRPGCRTRPDRRPVWVVGPVRVVMPFLIVRFPNL